MIREDMTMEAYRVLLFDIDNTLLDFTAGAMQSMEAIFLEAGLAYTPEMFGVFQTESSGRALSAGS